MPAYNNIKEKSKKSRLRQKRSKKGSSSNTNTTDNTKIHCRYGMECRDPNCTFFHHPMAAKDGVADEKAFYALMKQKEKTAAALAAKKAEARKEAAKKAERNDPVPLVGSKEYALMKQSEKDFPPLSTSPPTTKSSTSTSASILPICTEVGRPSVRHLSTPNSRIPTATTKKKCRWGLTCGDKHCTFLHPGQVFNPPAVITPKQLKSMNDDDDVDQPPSMSSVLSQMIANAPQPHSVLPPTNWSPDRHSVQPANDVLLTEYERAVSTSTLPPEAPVWTPDRHNVQPVSSVAVTTPPLLKIVSRTNLDSTSNEKGMAECVMEMSPKVVGWVIGHGGSRIKDMMNECGAKIWIDQESMAETEPRVVYVGGRRDSVQHAVQRIKEMVWEAPLSVTAGIDPGDAIRNPSTALSSMVLAATNTPPSTTQTNEDWERFRMQKGMNVKSTRPPLSASDITLLQRIIIEGRHIGKEPGTLKSHVGTMLKQTGPQKFENKVVRQEFIAQAIDTGVVYESGEGGYTSLHLSEAYENNLTTNMWGVIIEEDDGGGLKEPPRASPTSVQASEAILYKQVWGDQAYEGAAATNYDQGAVFPYPEESGVIPSPPRASPTSAAPSSSDGIMYKSTMWGSQQEGGAANYGLSYDQGIYNYSEESKVSTPPGLAPSLAPASEQTFGAIHDVFAKLGDPQAANEYGLDGGAKSYTPLYNNSSTSATLLTPSAFLSLESAFKPMPGETSFGETKMTEDSDEGSPFLFKYSY